MAARRWPSSLLQTSRVIGADSVLAGGGRGSPFAHSVRPAALLISVIAGSRGSDFDPKINSFGSFESYVQAQRVEMRRLELWRTTPIPLGSVQQSALASFAMAYQDRRLSRG